MLTIPSSHAPRASPRGPGVTAIRGAPPRPRSPGVARAIAARPRRCRSAHPRAVWPASGTAARARPARRASRPAGQTREAVRAVAHQGEPVRNGRGHDAELLHHARLVPQLAPAPIELDDPGASDALRQVLVRRTDDDLLHPRIGRRDRRRRGQGVVGLEVDHGPHDHAQRAQRLLERLELRVEQRVHALAGLVTRPETVPERLDHVIGGHAQVGRAALEHAEDRRDDAPHRAQLGRRVPVKGRPRREEVAEELVGAVDEVHDHSQNDTTGPWPDAVESTPP